MELTLSRRRIRLALTLLPLLIGVLVGLWQVDRQDGAGRAPFAALACASGTFLVIIALLEWVTHSSVDNEARKSFGWLSIVIGDDGYASTSKLQATLWTFGLAFAISFLGYLVVFGAQFEDCETADGCPVSAEAVFSEGGATGTDDSDWDNYLLLLGGPFAAAVLAKASTAAKASAGEIQVVAGAAATDNVKAEAAKNSNDRPSAGDLLTDNNGNLRLADTQYVIFNLVLFAYLAAQFINKAASGDFGLPDVPATLLALTGVSAAGYVATKASERSAPGISSAGYEPATGALTVTGVNLRPPGLSDAEARGATRVLATNPDETVTPTTVSATALSAKLRPGRSGTFSIKVVTSGTAATHDYIVTVA